MAREATEAPPPVAGGAAKPAQGIVRDRRIPNNVFGISFGIAGLAGTWSAARPILGTSTAVANTLYIMAAAIWLVLLVLYTSQGPRRIIADLRNQALGPFTSVAFITPMLVSSALAPYALDAARTLVAVFLALTVLLGAWMTGQWIVEPIDEDSANPSYFLPVAAGGLVGGSAASQVGMHAVAEASFGIGILCWIFFGAPLYSRLFFRPMMPTPLLPSLAIELAPPAVAGVAYFALSKGRIDAFATALAGFAVLMALVQVRLIPLYAKLHFSLTMWAFTFPYAAAATDAVLWIRARQPAGGTAYAAVAVGLITFFIATIAAFTLAALLRRTFLPKPARDAG